MEGPLFSSGVDHASQNNGSLLPQERAKRCAKHHRKVRPASEKIRPASGEIEAEDRGRSSYFSKA